MLAQKELKELEDILDQGKNSEEALAIDGLLGLLHAIAITPTPIMPSQWLPVVFDGEPAFDDVDQAQKMMTHLMHAYNHFIDLFHQDKLTFPFDLKFDDKNSLEKIANWAEGFFHGLQLRDDFWAGNTTSNISFDEKEELMACLGVVQAVAYPDEAADILLEKGMDLNSAEKHDNWEPKLLATAYSMLPGAVKIFHEFGKKQKPEAPLSGLPSQPTQALQPVRSQKVGRNAPCHCGSGMKFKKCCGGPNLTIH
jgi:uncharacterized protein